MTELWRAQAVLCRRRGGDAVITVTAMDDKERTVPLDVVPQDIQDGDYFLLRCSLTDGEDGPFLVEACEEQYKYKNIAELRANRDTLHPVVADLLGDDNRHPDALG